MYYIFEGKLKNPKWQVEEVFEMLQLLACIQTEKLQQHKLSRYVSLI